MTRHIFRLTLLVLLVFSTSIAVAGQSGGLNLSVSSTTAESGGEVTMTFEANNAGTQPTAVIVNITDRPDWTVTSLTNRSARWNDAGKWLIPTIEPDSSVSPTMTLSVPEDAAGEYPIAAMATTGDETVTTQATVQISANSDSEGSNAITNDFSLTDIPLIGVGVVALVILLLGMWVGSKT